MYMFFPFRHNTSNNRAQQLANIELRRGRQADLIDASARLVQLQLNSTITIYFI